MHCMFWTTLQKKWNMQKITKFKNKNFQALPVSLMLIVLILPLFSLVVSKCTSVPPLVGGWVKGQVCLHTLRSSVLWITSPLLSPPPLSNLQNYGSPFTPLLGQFLLEKDVQDKGVRHQSSKKEEDARWNGKWKLWESERGSCWKVKVLWLILTDPTSRRRLLSCPLCLGIHWSHCWRCWWGREKEWQAGPSSLVLPGWLIQIWGRWWWWWWCRWWCWDALQSLSRKNMCSRSCERHLRRNKEADPRCDHKESRG